MLEFKLLNNMLAIVRSTVHIRRIAGYASPDFKRAMFEFNKALAYSKDLPDAYKPIIKDFNMVYEALARNNMHMLSYIMN